MSAGVIAAHYADAASGGGGGTYSQTVLADGPVAFYRLGEAAGTTLVDSSGNGRDGSYAGGVTLGTAAVTNSATDKSATFDGSSGWAGFSSGSIPAWQQIGTTLTVEAWGSLTAANGVLVCRDNFIGGIALRSWAVYVDANYKPTCVIAVGSNLYTISGKSGDYRPGEPWHMAFTYDGATLRFYANGVLRGSIAIAGAINSGSYPLQIGRQGQPANYAKGRLDEVAIYDKVLTPEQILAHYTAGAPAIPATLHQALPTPTPTSNMPGGTIANAVDGNLSTIYQQQQNPNTDSYVILDYGAIYEINKVDFYNGGNSSATDGWPAWALEYSNGRDPFTTFATGGTTEYHGTGLHVEARYIRLRPTSNFTGWFYFRDLSAAYVP